MKGRRPCSGCEFVQLSDLMSCVAAEPVPCGKDLTISMPASSDMHPSSSGAVCASVDIWIRSGAASPRACDADSGALAPTPVATPAAPKATATCIMPPVASTAAGITGVQFDAALGASQVDSETVRKTLSMFVTDVVSRPCELAGAATASQAGDLGIADVSLVDDATPTLLRGVIERDCAGESPDAADEAQVTPRQHHRLSTLSTPLESGSASSGSPAGCGNVTGAHADAPAAPTTAELQHLVLARSSLKRREPEATVSPDAAVSRHKCHRRAPRTLDMAAHAGGAAAPGGPGCGGQADGSSAPDAHAGTDMQGFCNSDSPMICGACQEQHAQRSTEVTPKLLAAADQSDDEVVCAGAPDAEDDQAGTGAPRLAASLGDASMDVVEDDDKTTPCPEMLLSAAAQSVAPPQTAAGAGAVWSLATARRPPSGTPLTAVSLPPILPHAARQSPGPEQTMQLPQADAASAHSVPAVDDSPHTSGGDANAQQLECLVDVAHTTTAAAAECTVCPVSAGHSGGQEAAGMPSPMQAHRQGGAVGTADQSAFTSFTRIGIAPVRDARKRRGGRPVRACITSPQQLATSVPKRISPRLLIGRAVPSTCGGATATGSFSPPASAPADRSRPSHPSTEPPATLVRLAQPEHVVVGMPDCDSSAHHRACTDAEVPHADAAVVYTTAPPAESQNLESASDSAFACQGDPGSGTQPIQEQAGMSALVACAPDVPREPEHGHRGTRALTPGAAAAACGAVGPLASAPSPLLQSSEPPSPGHEGSPCTGAAPMPGNAWIEGDGGSPAHLQHDACAAQETAWRDGSDGRNSVLKAGPCTQSDPPPLCAHAASAGPGLDGGTASVATADPHDTPPHGDADASLQASPAPAEPHACSHSPLTHAHGAEGGVQHIAVPEVTQTGTEAGSGDDGASPEAIVEDLMEIDEELHISPAHAILFDPDVESPRACSAPERPPVPSFSSSSGVQQGEEVKPDAKMQAPLAAAATCERPAEAAPSSGVPGAEGVMRADGDVEKGFRRKRVISPSKVAARGRSRPASEAMLHTSVRPFPRQLCIQGQACYTVLCSVTSLSITQLCLAHAGTKAVTWSALPGRCLEGLFATMRPTGEQQPAERGDDAEYEHPPGLIHLPGPAPEFVADATRPQLQQPPLLCGGWRAALAESFVQWPLVPHLWCGPRPHVVAAEARRQRSTAIRLALAATSTPVARPALRWRHGPTCGTTVTRTHVKRG